VIVNAVTVAARAVMAVRVAGVEWPRGARR
jgi:hypothetical protein